MKDIFKNKLFYLVFVLTLIFLVVIYKLDFFQLTETVQTTNKTNSINEQLWLQNKPDEVKIEYFGVIKQIAPEEREEILELISSLKLNNELEYVEKMGIMLYLILQYGDTEIKYGFNFDEVFLYEGDDEPELYKVDEKIVAKLEQLLKFDYISELASQSTSN